MQEFPACSLNVTLDVACFGGGFHRHRPATLPPDLVQGDRAGYGGVQRANMSTHRHLYEKVTVLACQPADALPLIADDERDRTGQIGLIKACLRFSIQPDTPQPSLLQVVERAGDVGDAGHRQELYRTR